MVSLDHSYMLLLAAAHCYPLTSQFLFQVYPREGKTANVVESITGGTFEARLWGVADRESFAYPVGINLP